ncbi:MAG: hypothetical protein Q4F85_10395 [Prevotella sp.]|nr:hypothetical protein [Prevotella sp.]
MAQVDFKIVHKDGDVTIVRNATAAQKRSAVERQSIKVQCFDSRQIDRIFRYQEILSEHGDNKGSMLKKFLGF